MSPKKNPFRNLQKTYEEYGFDYDGNEIENPENSISLVQESSEENPFVFKLTDDNRVTNEINQKSTELFLQRYAEHIFQEQPKSLYSFARLGNLFYRYEKGSNLSSQEKEELLKLAEETLKQNITAKTRDDLNDLINSLKS